MIVHNIQFSVFIVIYEIIEDVFAFMGLSLAQFIEMLGITAIKHTHWR